MGLYTRKPNRKLHCIREIMEEMKAKQTKGNLNRNEKELVIKNLDWTKVPSLIKTKRTNKGLLTLAQ